MAREDDHEVDIWTTEEYHSRRDSRMFLVNFFGTRIKTTVTSNHRMIKEWIYRRLNFHSHRQCLGQLVVGLGVQWRPTCSSVDTADTLQLCIGAYGLVIQLSHVPFVPNILRALFRDERISFVGINNYSDENRLFRSRHMLSVWNLENLNELVASVTGDRHHLGSSMETLVRDVLGLVGVRKDPVIGGSNWEARHLTADQVQYACVDAHVSFLIGRKYEAWRT